MRLDGRSVGGRIRPCKRLGGQEAALASGLLALAMLVMGIADLPKGTRAHILLRRVDFVFERRGWSIGSFSSRMASTSR